MDLTILDRIAKRATNAANKEWHPLEQDYNAMGITWEDIYNKHVDSEFHTLEKALKLKPRLDQLKEKYGISKNKDKIEGNFFFITLRPSDQHKHRFSEFKHIVLTKYLTRSCFTSTCYAWEQKGETPETMGHGYHIHIIASCPNWLMKTQLLKDTKSTFKKFFNGEVDEAFVQIDYIRTKEDMNNKCAYIQGYKADEWKEPSCAMDKPWRQKYNLDDLYGILPISSSKSEATDD